MAVGFLVVQAATSRGVIPIAGASVSVLKGSAGAAELFAFRTTAGDGKTEPVALEAPAPALSQQPASVRPFTTCTVRASHPLYYTVEVDDVQIFAEETSLQQVEMVPLEENSNPKARVRTFLVEPQNL